MFNSNNNNKLYLPGYTNRLIKLTHLNSKKSNLKKEKSSKIWKNKNKWKKNIINSYKSYKYKKINKTCNTIKIKQKSKSPIFNKDLQDNNKNKNNLSYFVNKYRDYNISYNNSIDISSYNNKVKAKDFSFENEKIIYNKRIQFSLLNNNKSIINNPYYKDIKNLKRNSINIFLLKNSKNYRNLKNIDKNEKLIINKNNICKKNNLSSFKNINSDKFKYFLAQIKIGNRKKSILYLKNFPNLIKEVDQFKRNCLLWSVIRKHFKITKFIISVNLNYNILDIFNLNCWDYSIKNNDLRITGLLLLNLFSPIKIDENKINDENINKIICLSKKIWINNLNKFGIYNYKNIKNELKKVIKIKSEIYSEYDLKRKFNIEIKWFNIN